MSEEFTNADAEKRILTKLVNSPDTIFDIDGNIIKENDFAFPHTRCIYASIKAIASESSSLDKSAPIDATLLCEKLAILFPDFYQRSSGIKAAIAKIIAEPPPVERDFKEFIKIVVASSIKRQACKRLSDIQGQIKDMASPVEISNHIEAATIDFTSNLRVGADITILGSKFDQWITQKFDDVKAGKRQIGLKFGFPHYETAIGGGFRPCTLNVVAARAKMGKSFLGLTIAHNIAQQDIPVLYLDTELEDDYQTIRRVAKITQIPMYQLETGQFFGDATREDLIRVAQRHLQDKKIYYVDIKGWNIEAQVSIIRKFFARIVGKDANGNYKPCLIILDYLKLMSSGEKGNDKEWETLGYRMTMLHDLMKEYKAPMFVLVQQNRDGLDKEDESTVSGSDRIIWYCDNFTIFAKMAEADIIARQNSIQADPTASATPTKCENCKFKVIVSRHGPGTPGRKFIAVYADIHDPTLRMDEVCGIIEERAIQTTVVVK